MFSPHSIKSLSPEPSPPQQLTSFFKSDTIRLQVGGQNFITRPETLTEESDFFRSLLSRWEDCRDKQPDGSFFVDADPDLFKHILRYLRRGVLPLFYDDVQGHDHALYLAVLEEARFFGIPRLVDWLENKRYIQAVTISITATETEGLQDLKQRHASGERAEFHPVVRTEKYYVCPRGLAVHFNNPSACGKACRRAQGDEDDKYVEKKFWMTLAISRETTIDHHACTSTMSQSSFSVQEEVGDCVCMMGCSATRPSGPLSCVHWRALCGRRSYAQLSRHLAFEDKLK